MEDGDVVPAFERGGDEVLADEAGAPDDQDSHPVTVALV
jgi:hypothetical protein